MEPYVGYTHFINNT